MTPPLWQKVKRKPLDESERGYFMGFPDGSVVKNPPANAGDMGSIPGSGRSPGEGNGNQLQYSCLRNPMDRGAWQAPVHRVSKESDMTERLNSSILFNAS